MEPRTIYTFNHFHLGDNIFCCVMFSKIKEYIETNNIFIKHYLLKCYIDQIVEFNYSRNITFHILEEGLPNNVEQIDIWIGSSSHQYNFFQKNHYQRRNNPDDHFYDVFLCNFYNQILQKMNIPIQMSNFYFDKLDFLENERKVNEKAENAFSEMDFLIVNGTPQSNQIEYNQEEWDDIIRKFSMKYKIITTQKIDGILCTRDYNLTAKDIASIGKNAKKIIAIDSGVSIGLYNMYVFENVEAVYYLANVNKIKNDGIYFNNFINANHIRDLLFLL